MDINYFFIIVIITIVLSRIWLWFVPKHSPKIGSFQPHHYHFGLVLIVLYFFFNNIYLLAIGIAWVIDEIPLFFIYKKWKWPDDHWDEYHSLQSLGGIFSILIVCYITFYFL